MTGAVKSQPHPGNEGWSMSCCSVHACMPQDPHTFVLPVVESPAAEEARDGGWGTATAQRSRPEGGSVTFGKERIERQVGAAEVRGRSVKWEGSLPVVERSAVEEGDGDDGGWGWRQRGAAVPVGGGGARGGGGGRRGKSAAGQR
mmetsp:Transcript_7573/g.21481  ORF Transcript_7573/g.21481 Transcript_7573/m.21481 type:complete len:145 (+) Transcript_7573:503-937(+)